MEGEGREGTRACAGANVRALDARGRGDETRASAHITDARVGRKNGQEGVIIGDSEMCHACVRKRPPVLRAGSSTLVRSAFGPGL